MASKRLLKLGLILLLLLTTIFGANCEFSEEAQSVKSRLTISDPFQPDGIMEQDDLPDPPGSSQQMRQLPTPAKPSHHIWIPPEGYRMVKDPDGPGGGHAAPLDRSRNPRKKKDCGFPVLRRRLFGPVMKRSSSDKHYFANSEEEVQEKVKEEDSANYREKRSDVSESHSGGCLAKRQWLDMGADYYPRYVKTYHCSSNTCDRGFGTLGECKPKHYTTKVLKRITPADTTSVEDCDQTLPEALRVDWKLISVSVTTCCDCMSPAGRIFGLK